MNDRKRVYVNVNEERVSTSVSILLSCVEIAFSIISMRHIDQDTYINIVKLHV